MEVARRKDGFEYIVKKALPLDLGDTGTEFKTGCFVIDVAFPGGNSVNVSGSLVF